MTDNIFENQSPKELFSVKVTPQNFKKRHKAADNDQRNKFPIGDTTITGNSYTGATPMKQVFIEGSCDDVVGSIRISGLTTTVDTDCKILNFINTN